MRGLFVTATGTGVGKSVLSAALCAAMLAAGETVRAHKPVITGLEEPPEGVWPADDELLARVTGQAPEEIAPLRFGPAVSPHLAAELDGTKIDPEALVESIAGAGHDGTAIDVVEGVGGLLVPLAGGFLVRDLAARLGLPLIVATRPGLGAINHTLLTLQSARAAGLTVAAVVITPWPATPAAIETSNRETIAALGDVDVDVLASIAGPDAAQLAAAGATLPWRRWLGERP
jgi:dethiobiotin synthetase